MSISSITQDSTTPLWPRPMPERAPQSPTAPLPWLTRIDRIASRWIELPTKGRLARVNIAKTSFASGNQAWVKLDFQGFRHISMRISCPSNNFSTVDKIDLSVWSGHAWVNLYSIPLTDSPVLPIEHWCTAARSMAAPPRYLIFLDALAFGLLLR